MSFDDGPKIRFSTADSHSLRGEPDQASLAIRGQLQKRGLPPKEDFSSKLPGPGPRRLSRLTHKLLLQPGNILVKESARLCNRAAARNRHPSTPVRPQTQDIAPRPPMPNEMKADALCAHPYPVFVRRDRPVRIEAEIELHAAM